MVSKIRKRDGRIVPFDQVKIAAAISAAAGSVGCGNELLSEELASVVTLFLEKSFGGGIPSVDNVQDVVERVLMETGHADTARIFILHGERRKKQLEALRVLSVNQHATQRDEESDAVLDRDRAVVEVDHATYGSIAPWSKAKIIGDLVDEVGVPPAVASEIAAKVEDRVFRSGLVRISTSLISELVDNELFNRNFSGRTFGSMRVGLAAAEIRSLSESDAGGRTPADVGSGVADAIMKQFALRELYSAEEVELHLKEVALLEGLSYPSGYLEIYLDPRRLPAPFGSARVPVAYLGALVRFLNRFAATSVQIDLTDLGLEEVYLQGVDPATWAREMIATLALGPAGAPLPLQTPVVRLSRALSPMGEKILKSAGVRLKTWQELLDEIVIAVLDALSEVGRELAVPHLRVDLVGRESVDETLLSRLVILEAAGRVRLCANGEPICGLGAVEPLCSGVQLRLDRLQEIAGDLSGPRFFSELRSTLRLAVAAFTSKHRFLTKLLYRGRGPKAALRRFIGGDGSVVGPGVFRLSPTHLGAAVQSAFGRARDYRKAHAFVIEALELIQKVLASEERRQGLRIRLDPPWSIHDPLLARLFEDSRDEARELTMACAQSVGLSPFPDFFVGDARARIDFIQAILKAHTELDHAT